MCISVCSLWALRSLGELLHDFNELVSPVSGWADVDAEEVFLWSRGHGERVPLQLRDGRTVEEDVLAHLHFEPALHQLQLQHLGRPHHDLNGQDRGYAHRGASAPEGSGGGDESNIPSCIWPSACSEWNVSNARKDRETSARSPTSRSGEGKKGLSSSLRQ